MDRPNGDFFCLDKQNMKVSLNNYLEPFFPNEGEPIHIRGFKAKGEKDKPENRPRKWQTTRRELITIRTLQDELKTANKTRGLYFVVNAGGNEDKDITRFTAFYVEDDNRSIEEQHARLDACPLQPSIRVETRKSVHAYWLIDGDCSTDEWREAQERLIAYFDADEKIKNPSRVMRLPYFNHVHFNGNGYEYKRVEIAHFDPQRRYTVAQMQAAFPKAETQPEAKPKPKTTNTTRVFEHHEDRHEELRRRIEARGKRNSKGNIDAQALCHNGKGESGLVLFPNGAVNCNKGCSYDEILIAEGLPSEHLPSKKKANEKKDDAPLRVVCLADVVATVVRWLWFPYIPLGKLTILDGEEGIGKSWLLCAIIGRITQGELLPFALESMQGTVLMLSGSEDGLADTIKPRLIALSADCTKVFAIDEPFVFDEKGLIKLAALMAEYKPLLVIIDPLFDYVTAVTNINTDNQTRAVTKPLRELAERFGCAIVAVRHIGKAKGNGEARAAGLGGIGIRASGRSGLLVGCDPKDRSKRAIVLTKSNLADVNEAKAVGFTIENGKFYWLKESNLTAEKILARLESEEEQDEQNEAFVFLREALSDGEKLAYDIAREGEKLGLSEKRLRTARRHLKVKIRREGFGKGSKSYWSLPTINAHENNVGKYGMYDDSTGKYGENEQPDSLILAQENTIDAIDAHSQDMGKYDKYDESGAGMSEESEGEEYEFF